MILLPEKLCREACNPATLLMMRKLKLSILLLAVPSAIGAQEIPEHTCGPINSTAWLGAKMWVRAGGVKGIETFGVDSLRPLSDSADKEACWAINGGYINKHLPARSIFRLGSFYLIADVSMFEPPPAGRRPLYETDGTVMLLDDTYWPLAIGQTKLSDSKCAKRTAVAGKPGDSTFVETPCPIRRRPMVTR